MTAEVCIMNCYGVALAADSAVTVGPNRNTVYSTADKVFQLSHKDPIGIMVYGSATFRGVPWETLIKSYRRERENDSFPTVEAWRDDFQEFVAGTPSLFVNGNEFEVVDYLVVWMIDRANEEAKKRNPNATGAALVNEAIQFAELQARAVNKIARLPQFTVQDIVSIRDRARSIANSQLASLGVPAARLVHTIAKAVVKIFVRSQSLPIGRSGVALAGFGSSQYLPSLRSFELDGHFGGKLRSWNGPSGDITSGGQSMIVPFAQSDEVVAFLNGVHPSIHKSMSRGLERFVEGAVAGITNLVQPLLGGNSLPRERVLDAFQPALVQLNEDWQRQSGTHSRPVIDNVAVLPKENLGQMAEALVNLTKFRRMAVMELETVGGPIDVAVVSKGDGFVWTQRKHYFSADLNPRALAKMQ